MHLYFELNMAVRKTPEMTEQLTQMLSRIEEGQIGFDATLQGPYGAKRSKSSSDHLKESYYKYFFYLSIPYAVVYTDYTASGK